MTIRDRINEDLKTAMKSGEKLRLETIRTIRASMIEMDKRGLNRPMTDEEEVQVILAAAKKRKEAIELYEKGGRMDLVEQETKELEIIKQYLPEQLSPAEVETRLKEIIAQTGATGPKDLGKVMGVAMKEMKGKADGKVIQESVKRLLGA